MSKITIFKCIRSPKDHSKILKKVTIRIINVHDFFMGHGTKGQINFAEFKKLADDLEPDNDGISLS